MEAEARGGVRVAGGQHLLAQKAAVRRRGLGTPAKPSNTYAAFLVGALSCRLALAPSLQGSCNEGACLYLHPFCVFVQKSC